MNKWRFGLRGWKRPMSCPYRMYLVVPVSSTGQRRVETLAASPLDSVPGWEGSKSGGGPPTRILWWFMRRWPSCLWIFALLCPGSTWICQCPLVTSFLSSSCPLLLPALQTSSAWMWLLQLLTVLRTVSEECLLQPRWRCWALWDFFLGRCCPMKLRHFCELFSVKQLIRCFLKAKISQFQMI